MNYLMVQRELNTLAEDLDQMAEGIIGPEPPETKPGRPQPGRMALPQQEVRKQLGYVNAKLEAVIDLVEETVQGKES